MDLPLHEPSDSTPCSARLKALADETRLAIVRQLMKGAATVGEINQTLEVEPSLLSHHLKVLRESGILRSKRNGKFIIYELAHGIEGMGNAVDLGCCQLSFEEKNGETE